LQRQKSFTADTPVLMATAVEKAIKDVKLGDFGDGPEPSHGERVPRKVVDLIRHSGSHTVVNIRFLDGAVIEATDAPPVLGCRQTCMGRRRKEGLQRCPGCRELGLAPNERYCS
jgi:hypothetical protein